MGFFKKVKSLGTHDLTDYSFVRKIQLTNSLSVIAALLTVVLDVGFVFVGRDLLTVGFTFLIVIVLGLPLFWNCLKWHSFARNWFLAIMALSILSAPFFNGEHLFAEIIFLPSVGVPFLLFNRKELSNSILWSIIYMGMFFLTKFLYTIVEPIDPLTLEEGELMQSFLIVVLFFWMAWVFISLSNENKTREEIIEKTLGKEKELRKSLEVSYSKLVQSQDELINKEKERIKAQESERQALKKADFKSKFLAKMSHELRTPLNGIIGNLEIWKRKVELKDANEEYYNKVSNSSQLLLGIVNDVLDLSKIEDGKMELHPAPVSLEKVFLNSISLFDNLSNERGVKLELNFDDTLPKFVRLDSLRLSQVVNNLTSNAIKASENSEVKIKVSKWKGNKVKVSVIDKGMGLDKEDQSMIFNDYTQTSSYYESKGTGLGLSICKSLVKLMNGEIGVESEKGIGSIFWFTFQYELSSREDVAENLIEIKKVNLSLNVLLVDDMEINRSLARAMLEEYGCVVSEADCGKNALEQYQDDKYDLVLMDINMPDINGDEVVRAIRSKYKATSVFIGLSANAMEGEREKYIELGLDDYLSKPITFEKLLVGLQKWFDVKKRTPKSSVEDDGNGFLFNESKLLENAELMGGKKIFIKFIDKFVMQNQEIWSELISNYRVKDIELLKSNLHKLSGIATTMGAEGYYEILNEAYKTLKSGGVISEEEFEVLTSSNKEIEVGFNEIKTKWLEKES